MNREPIVVEELLKKGFIPILRHANPFYTTIEEEATARLLLLTGLPGSFFWLRSKRTNAYNLRCAGQNVIAITDSLLLTLEKSVRALLGSERFQAFFGQMGLPYDVDSSSEALIVGRQPRIAAGIPGNNTHDQLLFRVVEGAVIFILFHEISHIVGEREHDPDDLRASLIQTLDRLEHGDLYEERRADQEASWWLANRTNDALSEQHGGKVEQEIVLLSFGLAYFGAIVALIYMSESDEFGKGAAIDHPTFETRLEAIYESLDEYSARYPLLHIFILNVVSEIRSTIETAIYGKPSRYVFSTELPERLRGRGRQTGGLEALTELKLPFSCEGAPLPGLWPHVEERLRQELSEMKIRRLVRPFRAHNDAVFRVAANRNANCDVKFRVFGNVSTGENLMRLRIQRVSTLWTVYKATAILALFVFYARDELLGSGHHATGIPFFTALVVILILWFPLRFAAKRQLERYFPPPRLRQLLGTTAQTLDWELSPKLIPDPGIPETPAKAWGTRH